MKRLILYIMTIIVLVVSAGCGAGSANNKLKVSSDVKFGQNDYKQIVHAQNQLGFELLEKVEADENGNIFISPTSLFMALSMVYNGADGQTKEEIEAVLNTSGVEAENLNKANLSLMNQLMKDSKRIQVQIANSIWLNERFHFQDAFAKDNTDYYIAEIEEINISDSNSPKRINDWVKDATNKKIEEIVEGPLNPDLVALLINAIYFKGTWTHEFNKKMTKDESFQLENGQEKQVPLMFLKKKLGYFETDQFQAVRLPYGDGEMSMKVFLPKTASDFEAFQENLTNENWLKWNKEFRSKEGTILLPKFQLEYKAELVEPLKQLGMHSAFEKGANFSKMIEEPDPLWISKVTQKTFVDVTEEGTEAAALTAVEVVTESASMDNPFYMIVNRPFYFAITDDETDTILFIGVIANPPVKD